VRGARHWFAVPPRPGEDIGYRRDLDGLRAIAVGLVMYAHFGGPWKSNTADVGVTAFFVLSGYLITSLLVRERERTGRIQLGAFYRRRLVRLGPALLALLAFGLLLGVSGVLVSAWQLGLASSLLYVSNWVQAAGIAVHPVGHTWSLAIEEQFYVVWPLLLIVLWRRALWVAIGLIGVAIVARTFASGYFEYFSTITRMDAILLGCVLAFARPRVPSWVGVAGVVGLILTSVMLATDQHDVAIPAAMIATAAVIASPVAPLGRLAPVGLRAYSLYLWNTPMSLIFGPAGWIAPAMTVAIGELSFRLFERPVLRRGGARAPISARPEASAVVEPVRLSAVP